MKEQRFLRVCTQKILALAASGLLLTSLLGACSAPAKENSGNAAGGDASNNSAASSASGGANTASSKQATDRLEALPVASAGSGIDENINQETIDQYLNRDDVAYREVRMLYDPANFGEGTESNLTSTIKGFKVTPVVLLTNVALPLPGLYSGPSLYKTEWDSEGKIISATANYLESDEIIADLFPKDKAIFLQCGAGVYAGIAKDLLIYLGYDKDMVYNVGGNWTYTGTNAIDLKLKPSNTAGAGTAIKSWQADYAYIDFSLLHAK